MVLYYDSHGKPYLLSGEDGEWSEGKVEGVGTEIDM